MMMMMIMIMTWMLQRSAEQEAKDLRCWVTEWITWTKLRTSTTRCRRRLIARHQTWTCLPRHAFRSVYSYGKLSAMFTASSRVLYRRHMLKKLVHLLTLFVQVFWSGTGLILLLILLLLLTTCCFWATCSKTQVAVVSNQIWSRWNLAGTYLYDWLWRIFDLTWHFQDGGHDVISQRKVLPPGE